MTTTIAERVIDFMANLQGMDWLQSTIEEPRRAVIDLSNTAIIEADPEFPDGEMLIYERGNGLKSRVYTHKLIEQLLMRHAFELSITESGSGTVKQEYQAISDHFYIKTGFGK